MILVYRILFPILGVILFPYYLRRMLKRGGYGRYLWRRTGFWPRLPPPGKGTMRIWIQAVSVGELSSISKLLEMLADEKEIEIVLSATTSTGLAQATRNFSEQTIAIGPFPLDWWPCSSLAWSRIRPDMIITIDSELWPEHFEQARVRGIPAMVINARLSDRTFSRLSNSSLARSFLLPKGLEILTTSERQRSRWLELGLDPAHVRTTGNLKVDAASRGKLDDNQTNALRDEFGFSSESLVIAGISTWPGEEEILIDTVSELGRANVDARLLIVPRHAERRKRIIQLLENQPFPFHLRSQSKQAPAGTIIYLADTTGELAQLIQCADLGFVGKTMPPNRGGQNPIEPVSIGLPLVLGPNYQNFRETCGDLLLHEALLSRDSAGEVKTAMMDLAHHPEQRNELRDRALAWMEKQGSPSAITFRRIMEVLDHHRD